MKLVRPNYITLIINIAFLGYCLDLAITGKLEDGSGINGFWTLILFIGIIHSAWSLFGIFGIEYSEQDRIILFKNLLGGKKEVWTSEITGYYETTFKTRWKNYGGYIFKLSNGETIEITGYNLQSLTDFNAFIASAEIPCLGKKTSWYPLKRRV